MRLYAGLDRADTPDPRKRGSAREVYTICFVGVDCDPEELRLTINAVRNRLSVPADVELRGSSCPEYVQAGVVRELLQLGIRVAAAMYEKQDAEHFEGDISSQIADFQKDAALRLFREFVEKYGLAKLWCDEDVSGRKRQKAFETDLQRVHKAVRPMEHGFSARHRPSNHTELIQCADLIAHGLSRAERKLVKSKELIEALREIRENPENIVRGPMMWGI